MSLRDLDWHSPALHTHKHTHRDISVLTADGHSPLQQRACDGLFAVFIDGDEGCVNAAHSGLNTELQDPAPEGLCVGS